MYKFYFRACLFVTLLVFPYVIYAAGLGKLTLSSALGQPLKAEIDLVAVRDDESSSLTANLASQEAFRQAGISYKPFFSSLEIAIDDRANGDSYIRITSPNAINEPFLNILVELSWASGRLMREYTVLLDPIDAAPPEPVAPAIVDVPVAAETAIDEPEVQAEPVIEQVQPEPAVVSETFSGDTYGPVSQGDTLSKIAQQISPEGANLNQIMIALFRANQSAFIGNNINLLKVGEILHIPSSSEIMEISEQEANAEVKVHVADWRDYKNELAGVSDEAPAAETLKQVDTGEIITAVEDEIVALEAQPEEVLRLSGGVAEDMLGSADGESSHERIRMIEEDSIARSLALIEANERIELLEKNIKNLQQLLELKDPTMAQAQMQVENVHEEAPNMHEEISIDDLVPDSINDILPALSNIIDITEQELDELFSSDTELEESIAALDFTEESDNALAPVEAPTETPAEALAEASIMDQLMDNIAYVGGLLAFMLLSALIAIKIRRKKAENEAEEDDLNFDATSFLRNKAAAVGAVDSFASHEEADASQANEDSLDSEAEPEVQTETETSFDALDADSTKDNTDEIDLDFSQDEVVDESLAEPAALPDETDDLSQQMLEPDLDSGDDIDLDLDNLDESNVQSNDGEQPIELTDELIQDNADDPVEGSLAGDETGSDDELAFTDEAIASLEEAIQSERQAVAGTTESELEAEVEAEIEEVETAKSENEMDFEFNLDSDNQADAESSPAVAEEADGGAKAPEADNSISFDLDTPAEAAEDASLDQGASEEAEPQSQEEKLDLSIDFPEASDTPETADEMPEDTGADLADSSETPPETPASDTDAEPEEHDEHWHDVETKIDLAKAYIDMDDSEGAKEILEEVAQEGDAGQQEKANSMLEDLS